ncbi:MAG: KH domain-containing protein [Actinomycetota bacterium]|nr:KH domain-containing protein [Actinomycetota bacterium]
MAELMAEIARRLVDHPDAVRVETAEEDGDLVLELHVAEDDRGKVIGRNGRIARALRTLARAGSVREGRRVLLRIAG